MSKLKPSSNAKTPATSLDRWLTRRGLLGNPFERWNAEHDQDLPNYFVDIGGLDELLRLTEPCVVFAQRGCGKTAQRQMLAAHCRPLKKASPRLAVAYTYSGFERAINSANGDIEQMLPIHHVSALLDIGLTALMDEASRDPQVQGALTSPDVTSHLATYIARFAPHLSDASITGISSALDSLGSLELLQGFSGLVKNTGLESCVVLVDGVDEFPLMTDDSAQAVTFLAPLLGTLSLIECPNLAFKFFLPQGLEPTLRTCGWFRVDRLRIFRIAWNDNDLLALIKQRLIHFSHRDPAYEDLAQLCEDKLAQVINGELTALAQKMPRAALILADMLLQNHCQQSNPPELITLETWEQVKEKWQDRRVDFIMEERLPDAQQPKAAEAILSPAVGEPDYPVLRVEQAKGLVWLGECEIRSGIKAKDYSVLLCLYRHKSDVCSKDLIAKEAWPEAHIAGISDQAIAASIVRLRKVLRKFAPMREYIETVRGKRRTEGGYRLHSEGFD